MDRPNDQAADRANRGWRTRIRGPHLVILGAVITAGVVIAVAGPKAADPVIDAERSGQMLVGWRGGSHGGWHGDGGSMIAARLCSDQRADLIEDKLDLVETFVDFTDAQQAAWDDLADAMRSAGDRIGEVCPELDLTTPPTSATTTAPERLAEAELMMTVGLAVIQEIRPAFEALYAVLDHQQQDALNTMANRRMWRR